MLSSDNTKGIDKTVIFFMLEEKNISELYQKHSRELFSYLLRFTSSQENAEDLLHDTFAALIAYSKKNRIDESTIRAFLYKSAHNLALNFLNKNKKETLTEEMYTVTDKTSVEEDVSAKLLLSEIYRILDTLDETDRSIFIMKKELSMPTGEISEAVGKSERTVRRSLERTLKIIAGELKKDGFLPTSFISMTVFILSIVLLKGDDNSL